MSEGIPWVEPIMDAFKSYVGGRKLPSNVKVEGGYWNPYNLLYNACAKMPVSDARKFVQSWADTYDSQAKAFGKDVASKMTADRIIAEHEAGTLTWKGGGS